MRLIESGKATVSVSVNLLTISDETHAFQFNVDGETFGLRHLEAPDGWRGAPFSAKPV